MSFPAVAQEPFGEFKALCIDTNGDADAAIARARDEGWFDASKKMIEAAESASGFRNIRMLTSVASISPPPAHGYALAVGTISTPLPGLNPESGACSVLVLGGHSAEMSSQLREWIGFDAVDSPDDQFWAYSIRDGRPQSEAALSDADEAKIVEATIERQIYLVGIEEHSPSFLLWALPHKKP